MKLLLVSSILLVGALGSLPFLENSSSSGLLGGIESTIDKTLKEEISNYTFDIHLDFDPFKNVEPFPEDEIVFLLYTSQNPNNPITWTGGSTPHINRTKPIKYIIHGWLESASRDWYKEMTQAYLTKDDYNIIQIDWSKRSRRSYIKSAGYTKQVGRIIAQHILGSDIPLELVHIIGHSLGGQTAGFAGKHIRELKGKRIARISALDPARPGFENHADENKLTKDDANMVDVVHTDGGRYGCIDPLGTVDFFPNNGNRHQPGCRTIDSKPLEDELNCSHSRSHQFFIEAINSQGFIATQCSSFRKYLSGLCFMNKKVTFGEDTPSETTGVYYFRTASTKPYALQK